MKIIEFPSKNKKSISEQPSSEEDTGAEVIDISAFHDLDQLETERHDIELELDINSENDFFDKIVKTAKEISADEQDMAAAICNMVDALSSKVDPLRKKVFHARKSFLQNGW